MADVTKKPAKTPTQNESVVGLGKNVIQTAMNEVQKSGAAPMKLGDSMADKFKGLPMRELIAAPLVAAAEAQQELAETAWNFYQKIAFTGKNNDPRLLEFNIQRPIEQDGKMTMMNQKVSAPFIGLVPIPSLLIDNVDIDFQMEATNTENLKSMTNAEAEAKVTGKYWFLTAEISGKVSSSRENTRSTNQTGKYQVHVSASQQPQTEGLSKLMDIMASCIEPVSASTK